MLRHSLATHHDDAVAALHDDRRSFLFVHGAWHAAAHWNPVAEHLAALGHTVAAIDLPGSGLDAGYPESYLRGDAQALATEPSPLRDVHLADYVDAVTDQLTRMARHGKVTLVGHSFGGLTVTRVAEDVPHLVRRVVYISAYVPVAFPNGAAYGGLVGSVHDAARFATVHLNGGSLDGTRLISEQSVAQMQQLSASGPDLDVGLGWFRRRSDSRRGETSWSILAVAPATST